jgi:hypothetical protein
MSAPLTRPQGRIPIGYAVVNGARVPVTIDLEWDRYFTVLDARAGGVNGPGTEDLSIAQFDDAGIAEQQAQLFALADDIGQLPPPVTLPQPGATISTAVSLTLTNSLRTVYVTASGKTITMPAAASARDGDEWSVTLACPGWVDIARSGSDTFTIDGAQTAIRLDNVGASVSLRRLSSTSWGVV